MPRVVATLALATSVLLVSALAWSAPDNDTATPESQLRSYPSTPPDFALTAGLRGGIWRQSLGPLNRTLESRGFSATNSSHLLLGAEVELSFGRLHLFLTAESVDSSDSNATQTPGVRANLSSGGVGLGIAPELWRTARVSAYPVASLQAQNFQVLFNGEPTPVPVPTAWSVPEGSRASTSLVFLGAGLRVDTRWYLWGNGGERNFLVFGGRLMWMQQLLQGNWTMRLGDEGAQQDITGPTLNASGPVGLLTLGFSTERRN